MQSTVTNRALGIQRITYRYKRINNVNAGEKYSFIKLSTFHASAAAWYITIAAVIRVMSLLSTLPSHEVSGQANTEAINSP